VISQQLEHPRQNTGLKVLLFLILLAAPLVSAQPNLYHPELQRTIPLHTIDPEYLWSHLDDPAFQRTNDMNSIRDYLEAFVTPSSRISPLQTQELQALGIRQLYNPLTHQYVAVDALSSSQTQSLLQEPKSRMNTLQKASLRPMSLKAYYQEKNRPKPIELKKLGFRNSHLCITWFENRRFIRQTPPGCE